MPDISKTNVKPVIGCFPLYPPLELFHSMGLTPVILWGLAEKYDKTIHADQHIQNYCCGVARKMTEYILTDGEKELDALFMYNACDTLRNLPEILSCGLGDADLPMLKLHIPAARLDSDYGRNYLENEISNLIEGLEELTGHAFEMSSFRDSVSMYRLLREKLDAVNTCMANGTFGYAGTIQQLTSLNGLPVEKQIEALDAYLISQNVDSLPEKHKRIVVSGILPPPRYACEALDKAGFCVVADDTAMVGRSNGYTPDSYDSVAEYYYNFYMNHVPCSTLLHTADRKVDAIVDLVKQKKAKGFIFVGEKYCEYEYFELPYLEKKLQEAGIKVLVLEFALGDASHGAIQTRIDAFSEMLEEAP